MDEFEAMMERAIKATEDMEDVLDADEPEPTLDSIIQWRQLILDEAEAASPYISAGERHIMTLVALAMDLSYWTWRYVSENIENPPEAKDATDEPTV